MNLLIYHEIISNSSRSSSVHQHDLGQLTYVQEGVVSLETEIGIWFAPQGRLAWIPANLPHASHSNGSMRGWRLLLPHDLSAALPERPAILDSSALLLAALERLRLEAVSKELADLLYQLIRLELLTAGPRPFSIPLPAHPNFRAWALSFMEQPSIQVDLNQIAQRLGWSRSTTSRRFHQELGLSYQTWRKAVIVQYAVSRISEGVSINDMSFALGYNAASAFIAMFRDFMGVPPGSLLSQGNKRGLSKQK